MVDGEGDRALLNAYRNSIARYQRLLQTQLTDLESSYIKSRLVAYRAAVEALVAPESATCLSSSYQLEEFPGTAP